jgi:uncharacterized repeat protein (TIGR03943 family)
VVAEAGWRVADRGRLAEAGVLLGLAGLLLSLWRSGALLLYLNPSSVWLVMAGVPLLVLLAIGRLMGGRPADDGQAEPGPSGAPVRWYRLALLAAPLALGLALPARPLDASAAAGRTMNAVGLIGGARADQLAAGDTATFDLFDWAVALTREPDHRRFAGQPVGVEGFVVNEAGQRPGRHSLDDLAAGNEAFSVVRFVVTHCTADAAAVGLSVVAPAGSALPDDNWIRVEGHLDLQALEGVRKPVIVADTIRPIKPPANPYLSP